MHLVAFHHLPQPLSDQQSAPTKDHRLGQRGSVTRPAKLGQVSLPCVRDVGTNRFQRAGSHDYTDNLGE